MINYIDVIVTPKNTEYVDIAGRDNDCYGSIAEHPELITMDGVELTKRPLGGALRFIPDWESHSEYKAITLKKMMQSTFQKIQYIHLL